MNENEQVQQNNSAPKSRSLVKYMYAAVSVLLLSIIVVILYAVMFGNNEDSTDNSVTTNTGAYERPPAYDEEYSLVESDEMGAYMANMLLVRVDAYMGAKDVSRLWQDVEGAAAYQLAADLWEIRYVDGTDLEEVKADLNSQPGVLSAELNYVAELQHYPSDYQLVSDSSWLTAIGAPQAWDVTRGSSEILVGVLDIPTFTGHQDFGNGKVIALDNYVTGDHGTAVSGIIGAQTNNGGGIASIGYNTGVRTAAGCLQDDTTGVEFCPESLMIQGIELLMNNAVKVINMSVATRPIAGVTAVELPNLEPYIQDAYGLGIILVASAGNFGLTVPSYPAAYSQVISVGATDDNGIVQEWSNHGNYVDVYAPGVDVKTTFADGGYADFDGTSAAAPVVSGAIALLLDLDSTLTKAEIVSLLRGTSRDPDVLGVTPDAAVPGAQVQIINIGDAVDSLDSEDPDEVVDPPADGGYEGFGAGPVGDGIACVASEWIPQGPDVIVPPQRCRQVMKQWNNVLGAWTGQIKCEDEPCVEDWYFPNPEWFYTPTSQNTGQKDGTGMTQATRQYWAYDYETESSIEVPPFGFGVGGSSTLVDPGTATGASFNPAAFGADTAACGWPTGRPMGVSSQCNGGGCPGNATSCAADTHGAGASNGIDLLTPSGTPLYATMSGNMTRCVHTITKTTDYSLGYGVFVKIANGNTEVLYAHMTPTSADVNAMSNPTGGACGTNGRLVTSRPVTQGDHIGVSGETGYVTGPHLHYEVRVSGSRVCPASFMDGTEASCGTVADLGPSSVGADTNSLNIIDNVKNFMNSLNPFAQPDPSVENEDPGENFNG